MNIDVEVTFKLRATDQPGSGPPTQVPVGTLARLLDKLASHPWVVMILRKVTRYR